MAYLKKAYTVCVSTYQMAVLLAYNQTSTHTTASLAHFTQLTSHELASTVQSLLDSKILEQAAPPEGRANVGGAEKEGNPTLQLNMNYTNKRTKFKITAMLQKDSQQVNGR